MEQQKIEYLHDNGYMPDKFYYLLNGKTAQENYIEQTKKLKAQYAAQQTEELSDEEEQYFAKLLMEVKKDDKTAS